VWPISAAARLLTFEGGMRQHSQHRVNAAIGVETMPLNANDAAVAIAGIDAKLGVIALVRLYILRRHAQVVELVLDAVARKHDPG